MWNEHDSKYFENVGIANKLAIDDNNIYDTSKTCTNNDNYAELMTEDIHMTSADAMNFGAGRKMMSNIHPGMYAPSVIFNIGDKFSITILNPTRKTKWMTY